MTVSYEEARAAVVNHYVERGYSYEHSDSYIPTSPEEVFRLYDIIQKEKELSKRIKVIEEHIPGANLKIVRTVLMDEDNDSDDSP